MNSRIRSPAWWAGMAAEVVPTAVPMTVIATHYPFRRFLAVVVEQGQAVGGLTTLVFSSPPPGMYAAGAFGTPSKTPKYGCTLRSSRVTMK